MPALAVTSTLPPPVRVGLVGTGSWAASAHAPMLAAGPHTTLTGVFGRRPEAAARLAAAHGVRAFAAFDDLIEASQAVAFAVPPDVQAQLAPRAALAGRHLLLDKPLALDLAGAEGIAGAVAAAGVASLVLLTNRFAAATRAFLRDAQDAAALGARGWFVADALRRIPADVSPWRHAQGALFDLGPHLIDLADAALGPVVEGSVRARGDSTRWVGLLLEHSGGAVSALSLSLATSEGGGLGLEVYAADRLVSLQGARHATRDSPPPLATAASEFAAAARGLPHPCDAAHGLRLQRLIAEAAAQLEAGSREREQPT
ncbi:MAG: Gfo/Idh/MocA family protein [Candidatus Dormibacteria bacterium]